MKTEEKKYMKCESCGKMIDLEEDSFFALNGKIVCEDCFDEEFLKIKRVIK